MATPTVPDYLKYADLQTAAEPMYIVAPNPAVDPVRFALWTLRDEAAQRRSLLRSASHPIG
ncbi:MAG: hypothetical protein Q7T44_17600 [Parvibaculum sp.]|nr:hypothetical protein [Parvibaculum sp.]